MDPHVIEQLILLIVTGAIVAIAARRFRIPYTVGLVITGIAMAFLPIHINIPLSKEFLFEFLLPPLIFEAAMSINWRELRRDLPVIGTFATAGVVLSAAVTAGIMHLLMGWPWPAAVIFGILIAATDPVSIIATFKESNVKGRVRLLVEAESLFNDSTAAVALTVAVAFFLGESTGFQSVVLSFLISAAGGLVLGIIVSAAALLLIGRTKDHLVELTMTTFAAFVSFWVAERMGVSGILATTAAGLVIGNRMGRGSITERGEESIEHFWQFAAFVSNTIIFIVLGINLAYQQFAPSRFIIISGITAVLIGRAVAVYPISFLFTRSRWKVDRSQQHILFWGGLRGALALALALGIPDDFPLRHEILITTFGVVAFSVFVQGTTVTGLMRILGILPNAKPQAGEPAKMVKSE